MHAGPVWLPLGGDSSGCSCPTKEVWGGQGQTNGTGGFGFPESLLHIWRLPVLQQGKVTVSPW